jgi:antitoxin (DNA-binding transcriptional repressor) of toxin-antitoxin stability system
MTTINMHEAKTHLSRLVEDVLQTGEVYVNCRGGTPVAELRSIPKQKDPLKVDPALSVVLHENPAQPLEADDWPDAFSR